MMVGTDIKSTYPVLSKEKKPFINTANQTKLPLLKEFQNCYSKKFFPEKAQRSRSRVSWAQKTLRHLYALLIRIKWAAAFTPFSFLNNPRLLIRLFKTILLWLNKEPILFEFFMKSLCFSSSLWFLSSFYFLSFLIPIVHSKSLCGALLIKSDSWIDRLCVKREVLKNLSFLFSSSCFREVKTLTLFYMGKSFDVDIDLFFFEK